MKRVIVLIIAALALAGCSAKAASSSTTASPKVTSSTAPATNGKSPTSPIPLGQTASVDGWTVKVVSVEPETTDPVTSSTAPDYQSLVYTLSATRTGSSPAAAIELDPEILAANHLTYSADSDPNCYGGTPDNDQVYTGGTTMDSACISVPNAAASHMVIGLGLISQTWFATTGNG